MSRIGKLPIPVTDKVKVAVEDGVVRVEGPKGKLEKRFDPNVVQIDEIEGQIIVKPQGSSRHARAMHGTARSIVASMLEGVTNGYEKNLIISGVGFRAVLKGQLLELSLGYSHTIEHPIPSGITVTLADPTKVKVQGPDKQAVGHFAAQIKGFKPAEPYKGKGVVIDGEYVRRKEGKKAG